MPDMKGIGRTDFVEKFGLWSQAQREAASEVAQRVRAAGIEVVRLSFADQHGILRGKAIVAAELDAVLRNGCSMTTTLLAKDTSHRTVYPVWKPGGGFRMTEMEGASDFVMVADPTTFRILPWAEKTGWLLCDCYFPNGAAVPFSTRQLCRDALQRLASKGFDFLAGLELEFYVYKLLDPKLEPAHCGQPSEPPDVRMVCHGFQYLTEMRLDELDPILSRLRSTLLSLGLPLRTLENEFGPSQCELTTRPTVGLAAADDAIVLRNAIKQVCRRDGYHATFMCRPALANSLSSGWHLHQSLLDTRTGANAFVCEQPPEILSPIGRQFVAGLLEHARGACLLSTPTINGYKRYRPYSLAPDRAVWGQDNRGTMIRVIGAAGDPATHVENRVGEPAANPYLYVASQVIAGLDGIERQLVPPAATHEPYDADAPLLPRNLVEAVAAFRGSELFRSRLGDTFVDYYATIKEAELKRFLSDEVTDWEQREYFEMF